MTAVFQFVPKHKSPLEASWVKWAEQEDIRMETVGEGGASAASNDVSRRTEVQRRVSYFHLLPEYEKVVDGTMQNNHLQTL